MPSRKKANQRIRIGVIGLGRIGWSFHCRQIRQHRQFILTAVADPVEDRIREAERDLGCKGFRDYGKMLKGADLDAVVIASPTHMHKDQALACFRKGLHVFLEKPMATTYKEARLIVQAARRAKRKLTIYQPHRAADYFQHLLRILKAGKIGELYQVKFGRYRFVRRDDWQALRKFGGGMLNNYGAHVIDQMLHLIGTDIRKIHCQLRLVAALGDAEDVVRILAETRKGAIGEIDINQASTMNPYRMLLWGTHGTIRHEGDEIHITRFNPRKLPKKSLNRDLASTGRRYPRDQVKMIEEVVKVNPRYEVDVYKDFAEAIRTGKEPFIRPEETLALMKFMEACRKESGGIRATSIG